MAEVRLPIIEGRVPPLPPVCIRCGRPADGHRNIRVGVGSFTFVRPKLAMPVCRFHRLTAGFGWLAAAVVSLLIGIAAAAFTGRYAPLIFICGVVASLAVGYEMATLGIRGEPGGGGFVTLTGVCPQFAEAVGRISICLKCGYDLTGNVSGVCPECGSAVRKGKGA